MLGFHAISEAAIGELVEAGGGPTTALGTITFIGDLAARGTSRAFGTIVIVGDLAARGTSRAIASSTITGSLAATNHSLAFCVISHIGTLIAGGGVSNGFATSTFSGQLIAIGNVKVFATGTTTIIGNLASIGLSLGGIQVASGISTFIGDLVAAGVSRAFGAITATGDLAANGNQTASGYIDVFGTEVASGTNLARATITVIGDSAAVGVKNALGTITVIGDVSATGAQSLITASGTIVVIGSQDSTGIQFGFATITLTGDLVASGGLFVSNTLGSGLILVAGTLDAIAKQFCPISAKGSINLSSALVAFEDPLDDTVTMSASILISSDLKAHGIVSSLNGALLAYATINIFGDMPRASFRKVTCITPTATMTWLGLAMSADFTDVNLFRSFATINVIGVLGVSAIYARATAIAVSGSLLALGRVLPVGDAVLDSEASVFIIAGRIGPGTIDGQKRSVIRQAFGSVEIYNNSRGGFYTVGASGIVKEAFTLVNYTGSLSAKGSVDQIKFARGTSVTIGRADSVGRSNGFATSTYRGELTSRGSTLARSTITIIGEVAAISSIPFSPTYNGAQSPTIIGNSLASYSADPMDTGEAQAASSTRITINASASDCVINIFGTQGGIVFNNSSFAQASTNIFNLNVRPDSVKIRLVSAAYVDTDRANYPSTAPKHGTFTDNVAFNPTNAVLYGYTALTAVDAIKPALNPPTIQEDGRIDPIVEFTFAKSGFQDLVVTYKIRARSSANADV